MFDIGFWEILIITLVALLVVGPERLPGLAREIGRFVGKARRFVNSVRSDIEQELQTEELRKMLKGQEKEIQDLKSMMQDTEETLREDLRETEEALREQPDTGKRQKKKLDPEGRPDSGSSPGKAAGEPPGDTPPSVKRVPLQGSLDADLMTESPARKEPATAERGEDDGRTDSDGNANKA
ncbi:MAG: twin-arginine translocase subunit TatB [Thioalkalivibrio sp.]|nr:MAG: twin-arginine translocase subunit TatB [Thioalkalivibrio sp.]